MEIEKDLLGEVVIKGFKTTFKIQQEQTLLPFFSHSPSSLKLSRQCRFLRCLQC